MKTKLYLSIMISLFVFEFALGQAEIEWQKTFGGDSADIIYCMKQTFDGGYILAGSSGSDISGDKTESCSGGSDIWLLKIDSVGNIQWQNTIGGNGGESIWSTNIVQTSDGGYAFGAWSSSNISGDKWENCVGATDYWLVKTNSLGYVQWQNTIGGTGQEFLCSMQQTLDGGYILGGWSRSDSSGNKTEDCLGFEDYWIVKTDSVGNVQWENTIGGNGEDWLNSIRQTFDGGYIFGGWSNSHISGDKTEDCYGYADEWIVKTDSIGNMQWQKSIGGNHMNSVQDIQQAQDGGYILAGYSSSDISGDKTESCRGNTDCWIVKTDSIGNIVWQKTIGGAGYDGIQSFQQMPDGGYVLGGYSDSKNSGEKTSDSYGLNDYWILKIDSVGAIEWQNTIGGSGDDYFSYLQQTADSNYILCGFTNSNISGDKSENSKGLNDFWIIKLTDKFNSITGKTFLDFDADNIQDSIEPAFEGELITESNTNRMTFSEQNGHYSVSVLDTGTYQVSPKTLNYYNAVPLSQTATFTGLKQTDSLNDFALQPIAAINDLQITMTPLTLFRANANASYMLNYKNVGTTTIMASVIFLKDPSSTYQYSSVSPALVTADSVVWDSITLAPFQEGSITVTVHVYSGLPIGTKFNSLSVITPVASDTVPADNYAAWQMTITGSFDPNDKIVSQRTLDPTQLAASPYLDYIIHFQNTGTDTAFNIRVLDNIPSNLDITTFQLVSSSDSVKMTYKSSSRLMTFAFNNILLPDSNINEPASHGFIRYRIKPISTLAVGDSIKNTSFIYFDSNQPVQTNTAVTAITPCALASINLTAWLFCLGDTVNATAVINYPSSVAWYVGGVFFSNNQSVSIPNLTLGLHQLKLTATNAYCSQDVIYNVLIFALPPKPVITQNLAVLTSSSTTGNEWYMNGSIIAGANNTTYTVTLDGWYYVKVTNIDGCKNVSDSIYMMVSAVDENQNSNGLKLFPNPVHDVLNVSLNKPLPANTIITINDMQGRVVKEERITQSNSSVIPINVSTLSQGVYLLRVNGVVRRFVKL